MIFNEYHLHFFSDSHLLPMVSFSFSSSSFQIIIILANSSIFHSQSQPQILYTSARSNTIPLWRGHLPVNLRLIHLNSRQITTHFSRKVFLGGIPAELTEGKSIVKQRDLVLSIRVSYFSSTLTCIEKIR